MSKIANEDELVKKALQIGAVYAKKRAYGAFEQQDPIKLKVEFVYRVLVEDKLIQPLAKDQIQTPTCATSWHCGFHGNCPQTIHCCQSLNKGLNRKLF